MSELAFLHTAPVHVQTFDGLLRSLRSQTAARHLVRGELLAQARQLGSDHADVAEAVGAAVDEAAALAPVVLCTCSTIGALAEGAGRDRPGARVLRVDRPMAEAALDLGPRVVVTAVLESTLAPTRTLLESVAAQRGVRMTVRQVLLPQAWPLFEQGDLQGFHQLIAAALGDIRDADAVVLAQASMAGARDLLPRDGPQVLASPELGLRAALAALP
jgi:hypothetical protein